MGREQASWSRSQAEPGAMGHEPLIRFILGSMLAQLGSAVYQQLFVDWGWEGLSAVWKEVTFPSGAFYGAVGLPLSFR